MRHRWTYDKKRGRCRCLRRRCDATRIPKPGLIPDKLEQLVGPAFVDTAPCRAKK